MRVIGVVPILRHRNGIVPACTIARHGATTTSISSDLVMESLLFLSRPVSVSELLLWFHALVEW